MHNVYLVQPNFNFGPGNNPEYYLPYSIAILWSYAYQFDVIKNNYTLSELLFYRENIDQVLDRLDNPSVIAFSCYVWNWNYNKELARRVKEKFPKCLIVFGGPNVTDKPFQKLFFQQHRYVDCIINGEGEYSFKELLEDYANSEPIKKIYTSSRIEDLSTIPSPYLTGVFDNIIENNPNIGWHMTFETNRGCPFACTFCDWGSLTYSKIKKFDYDRVISELHWGVKNQIVFLFIADANFGIFVERDMQIATEIAKLMKETGYPPHVNVNWNKNAKSNIVKLGKVLGSRGLTVAIQSLNDQTLEEIKRKNMDVSDLSKLLPECEKEQLPVYTELILGMPYETKITWRDGHYKLLDYNQHAMLDIYLTMLLENSELNSQEQIDKHRIKLINAETYLGNNGDLEKDNVTELIALVTGTQYMPFEDLIDSFMFSWMMVTFHYIGYTQIYSRYLNSTGQVSYRQFYDNLIEYITNSNGLLNAEYQKTKHIITKYLSTGKLDTTSEFGSGNTIIWNSIIIFSRQNKTVHLELEEFINKQFKDEINKEVIYFQKHFIVDIDRNYPYNLEISKSLYETVFQTTIDTDSLNLKLTLDSVIKNKDINDFCRKFYTGRRYGSSKVVINTNIDIKLWQTAEEQTQF